MAKDSPGSPFTLEDIKRDYDALRRDFKKRDRLFDLYENLYFLEHYTDNPEEEEGEHQVTLPIYTNHINMALSMVTQKPPLINIIYDDTSKADAKRKGQTEKFLYAARYMNNTIAGRNFFYDQTFNLFLFGWGVTRTLWDPDIDERNKETDDEDERELPLIWQSINPKHIYCRPGGPRGGWRTVMFALNRPVTEIESEMGVKVKFPLVRDNRGRFARKPEDPTEVLFIDYWTWWGRDIYHAIIAGEEFIKHPTKMPEYTFIPYTIAFCIPTPLGPYPERWGLSFLFALRDSTEDLERAMSRLLRVIGMYGDPTIVTESEQPGNIDIDKRIGSVIDIKTGEKVYYLHSQGSPPDLLRAIEFFRGQVQESGFPSVSLGMGVAGASGYATNLLQEGGRVKIEVPVQNLQLAWQADNEKMLRLFYTFSRDEKLVMSGPFKTGKYERISIKGSDVKGLWHNEVVIEPKFVLDERRDMDIGVTGVREGFWSKRYAQEKYGHIEDPELEAERMRDEAVENDPRIREAAVTRRLIREGMLDPEQDMTQQGGNGSGAKRPPGRPEELDVGLRGPIPRDEYTDMLPQEAEMPMEMRMPLEPREA
uniref:Portal protein n=1 Tax=viral metagenome TaxID=1070528 RepID=A0A6M3J4L0_9ZZZZ